MTETLTPDEHAAIRLTADLWGHLCRIVGDGPSSQEDLAELCTHIHAIQHTVMAQAAGRAHPELYRLLGEVGTWTSPEDGSAPSGPDQDQDHALIIYAENGIQIPRESLEAIGPRGVLILPLSMRPEPQSITAETVLDEQRPEPEQVPVAPWMTGEDPTEPRTYRGKRRAEGEPSTEVCGYAPPSGWQAGSPTCDRPAGHDGDHHWGDDPGDAITELATALIHTREYVGEDRLPALPGWSWYDALSRYAPDQLQQTLDGYATQVTERTAAATAAASDPWAEGTDDGYSVPHLRRALEYLRDLGQTTSQVPGGHLMRLCNDALTGRKPRP